jgi:hypothetical protein
MDTIPRRQMFERGLKVQNQISFHPEFHPSRLWHEVAFYARI